MANYIKIPVSNDSGLPLAASGDIVDDANWDFTSITTVTASQSSGPLSSTVSPIYIQSSPNFTASISNLRACSI